MLDDLKEEAIVNKVGGASALDPDPEAHGGAEHGAKALVDVKVETRWRSWFRRSCKTRSSWTIRTGACSWHQRRRRGPSSHADRSVVRLVRKFSVVSFQCLQED